MRWLLVIVAACGSKSPPPAHESVEADPAWAKDYEKKAADACTCKDPDCLNRAHAELAAIEAQHGGMDEAPPGVQEAHGTFDRCWREGTRDEGRDLELAATGICGCADAACLRTAKLELLHLADKYKVSDVSELASRSPAAAAALQRAGKCLADVTMPPADYVDAIEKLNAEMCDCRDASCAGAMVRKRGVALAKYIEIGERDGAQQARVDEVDAKWCRCFTEAVAHDIADKLTPFPNARIDINASCN